MTKGRPGKSASADAAAGDDDDGDEESPVTEDYWNFVASQVARWHHQRPRASLAVLTRTNETAASIVYQLKRRGLAVSDEGKSSLEDSAAVQLVLSALRLVDHPGDTAARFHLASSPWGTELGWKDWKDGAAVEGWAARIRRQLLEDGYGAVVGKWCEQLAQIGSDRDRRRLQRLGELAFQYEPEATLSTEDFIERILHDRVADLTAARIRVMTVHASKGLQFDIVVLPELAGRARGTTPRYLTESSGTDQRISRIIAYPNKAIRDRLPEHWRQMVRDYEQKTVEAWLAVLYVAMTRAVHALHMVIPENVRADGVSLEADVSKLLAASHAKLIRGTCVAGAEGHCGDEVFVAGNPDWQLRPEQGSADLVTDTSIAHVRLASTIPQRRRGLASDSPSAREGGTLTTTAQMLKVGDATPLRFGTAVHAWLEQIEWLERPPERASLSRTVAQYAATTAELASWCDRFLGWLSDERVRQVLDRERYWRQFVDRVPRSLSKPLHSPDVRLIVRRECQIAFRDDDRLVTGAIDRLVLFQLNGHTIAADIIDFKTDRVTNDSELEARRAYYQPQLAAYAKGVQTMLRLDPAAVMSQLLFLPCEN